MPVTESEIRNPKSQIARLLCLLTLAILSACTPQNTDQSQLPTAPPLPPITYAQLAAGYNQRIALVQQLWSSTSIIIRWTDDKGDNHTEQGEGPLIWRQPDDLAFAIGKLGNTRFWLGSGSQSQLWWLFDLGDEHRIAYRGRLSQPLSPADRQLLPVPVRPDQLTRILGFTPLDPAASPTLAIQSDRYILTFPPEPALGNLHQQLHIDPQFRAIRIILLDSHDQPVVDASLSNFKPLKLIDRAPGAYPDIAANIDITLTQPAATVSIRMSEPSDGKLNNRVKDIQFDFDKLAPALKITEIHPPTLPAPETPGIPDSPKPADEPSPANLPASPLPTPDSSPDSSPAPAPNPSTPTPSSPSNP